MGYSKRITTPLLYKIKFLNYESSWGIFFGYTNYCLHDHFPAPQSVAAVQMSLTLRSGLPPTLFKY